MKILQIVFIIVVMAITFAGFIDEAEAVNLQDYMVSSQVIAMQNSQGIVTSIHTFQPASALYKKIAKKHWSIKKRGYLVTWTKQYLKNGKFKTIATQPLLFSNDGSIIELGGVRKKEIVSYGGGKTGLYWSKGLLSSNPKVNETQITKSGKHVYSKTQLIEQLPEYTVNGVTYTDVIRLRFTHGTKNNLPINCGFPKHKDFNSYQSDFWFARGKGMIKQAINYIEDGSFFNAANCIGGFTTERAN